MKIYSNVFNLSLQIKTEYSSERAASLTVYKSNIVQKYWQNSTYYISTESKDAKLSRFTKIMKSK